VATPRFRSRVAIESRKSARMLVHTISVEDLAKFAMASATWLLSSGVNNSMIAEAF
jgi:hypothetical protein